MPEPAALQMQLVTGAGIALRFKSMSAREEVSRLFEFDIVGISDDNALGADDLLGTSVAVALEMADGSNRWWHGVIASFGIDGVDGRHFTYRLTARPWLWLLTRSADVRIFQAMTAPDIVKQVLDEYAGAVVDELGGSYVTRDYCVQYRETDFNFVSRLLEEEGIGYFFRHTESQHELVLFDAASSNKTAPGFEEVLYLEDDRGLAEQQAINEWRMQHEIQTGKLVLRDYNFETPSTDLTTTATSTRRHAEAGYAIYDYPGLYAATADGNARSGVRLHELEGRHTRFVGQGNVPGLLAGSRFKLVNHPRDDQNAEYLLLSTQTEMQIASSEAMDGDDTLFGVRFTAQLYAEPFRPARITRKPAVAGPQTAVVVGDGNAGAIHTDEHARVKVQFHWDRLGERNADSSCWVRVATPLAGNGWGMVSLPRLGQEVVVDFLEGDPDRPLITGRVYNAEQKPPYELPANGSVSTFKSRSVEGAAADFNELRFEDKPGGEYVLLHAQKDRLEFVEGTLKASIGGEEHRTVKGQRREKIEGEYHLGVTKDARHKYDAKYSVTVAEGMLLKTDDIWSLKAAQDITLQTGAALSIKSGDDLHVEVGANIGAEAAQNVYIKGGAAVVIEGASEITLKVGGSSVVLKAAEVSVTGALVKINSGGAGGSGIAPAPVAPTDPDPPKDPGLPRDPLSHR